MASSEANALSEELGRRIAAARKRKGWSQRRLAGACDLTRGSVANIELGRQKPPLDTLWTLGLALDVEPRWLIPTRTDLAVLFPVGELPTHLEKFVSGLARSEPKVKAFISATKAGASSDG